MGGRWLTTSWGELAELHYGKALAGYGQSPAEARVYGTNGPIGWYNRPLWQPPGVVIGRKGAYRGVHFATDPYWVIDTAYSLQPKVDINLRWAYYQLRSVDLSNVDDGSPVPSTTRPDFYALPVRHPPRREQDRIAAFLGTLDDKIELNRRIGETLEEMARALFKSWFVDFDPVRAKAEGRPTGLPDATATLFPDAFDDDGLPEGWGRVPLLNHARLISGGTPRTNEPAFWNGSIRWASAKDVSQCPDRFLLGTQRTITPRGVKESATRMLPKLATVVVARGATTGRHRLVGHDMAMNQTCYAVVSTRDAPIWTWCSFANLIDELVQSAHGSVFDTITTSTFETAHVKIDNGLLVELFEAQAAPMLEKVLAVTQQSFTLSEIRDLLLPQLISGELRIRDAEALVAAA